MNPEDIIAIVFIISSSVISGFEWPLKKFTITQKTIYIKYEYP